MTMSTEDESTYELRATRPDGSVTSAGVFATHVAAIAEAWRLLSTGDARRVETRRRHGGRADLLSVIGEPRRAMSNDADDRLRPQHDDGGMIW